VKEFRESKGGPGRETSEGERGTDGQTDGGREGTHTHTHTHSDLRRIDPRGVGFRV
jgi:hypothetical protein